MRWRPLRPFILALAFLSSAFPVCREGHAEGNVVPGPTALPSPLTLDESLRIFRTRGLDLLIAEAAVRTAEGAVQMAGAPPAGNPVLNASLGNAFTYVTNQAACDQNTAQKGAASLTDYLDALRTYITTNVEYFSNLSKYWTAVFQLEEAVGMEFCR